ncbi:MAG: Ni/Fe hydrogenase subunit alpha [Thermoprotei archaeon]
MTSKHYVLIDPVTRVEGEARVVVVMNDKNEVSEVYYQIIAGRGYESFTVGRAIEELPRITSTVCGVCSWAHHMASGKALDDLLGRKVPEPARKLREFAYYMQIIDSHLLHFGIMALPDLLLYNASPIERNIIGILKTEPRIASIILKSRDYIKQIEKILGGKPIHTAFVLPGGVTRGLKQEDIDKLKKPITELRKVVDEVVEFFNKKIVKSEVFQNYLYDQAYMLRTYYMSLVEKDGTLTFYDGILKIIDSSGREVARFDAREYTEYIAEHVTNWSYSKFPYLRKIGWKGFNEEYVLRVGPLARLNIADRIPSERASEEAKFMFETLGGKPVHNTMAYHWARIIETLYSIERMEEMIDDQDLLSKDIVNLDGEIKYEGVGVIEAPRGTLIHHYRADNKLISTHVNIITPTTFNNTAINAELKKVVKKALEKGSIDHISLNKIKISIRAYDPCNSCAAHYIDLTKEGEWKILVINASTGEKMLKKIKIV